MPRERKIRSELFKHEHLADLNPLYRILFMGLWCHADCRGYLEYRPRYLKTQILPYDDCNIEEGLAELHKFGFIVVYQVDGRWYIWIPKFTAHQDPHPKEHPNNCPPFTSETPEQVLKHPIKPPPLFTEKNLSTDQSRAPQGLIESRLPATCQQPASKPFPALPSFTTGPSQPALKLGDEVPAVPRDNDATTAGPAAPSFNLAKRRDDAALRAWRSWDRLGACLREQKCEPRFTESGVNRIMAFCRSKVPADTPPPIELELQALAVVLYTIHYCPPTTENLDGLVGYCVKAIAKNLAEQRGTIEPYEHMASRMLREVEVPNFNKPAAPVSAERKQAYEDLIKGIGKDVPK